MLQKINNVKELKKWLDDQQVEVSVAISARTALRMAPLITPAPGGAYAEHSNQFETGIVMPLLRATAVSWVTAVGPAQETDILSLARSASDSAAFSARSALSDHSALSALSAAAHSAAAAAHSTATTALSAHSATLSVTESATARSAAREVVWEAIADDARSVEDGASPDALALMSLWSETPGTPEWAVSAWQDFKGLLAKSNDSWNVWIDWYEARLRGGWTYPELDEEKNREIETRRVLIADKDWDEGPAHVNALIKEIIDKYRDTPKTTPEQENPTNPLALIDAVPTHNDQAAEHDLLNRRPFAEVIAETMHHIRMAPRPDGPESFAINLHGPWGTGKSSILNFMRDWLTHKDRGKQQWLVVEFNVWQHEHNRPPWWPLIKTLYDDMYGQLREIEPVRAGDLQNVWRNWKLRTSWLPYTMIFGGLILIIWAMVGGGSSDAFLQTIKSWLTLIGAIAGILITMKGLSQTFVFGSSKAAQTYSDLSAEPLKPMTTLFDKLITATDHPVAIFIDDLDRCNHDYVIELLEGIQTMFRGKGVTYVVAADRKWITTSFEKHYQDFVKPIGAAGRPLGFLFLEKIFQISVSVPGMPDDKKSVFWQELLRPDGTGGGAVTPEKFKEAETQARQDIETRVADGGETIDEVIAAIESGTGDGAATPLERRAYQVAGAKMATSSTGEHEARHTLAAFAAVLPENPRFMKRMINAYGLHRAVGRLDGKKLEPDPVARWTIIEQRWPALAEHLVTAPDDIKLIGKTNKKGAIPDIIKQFSNNEDLLNIVIEDGKPALLPAHIEDITGHGGV